jgi:colicin import membrane protein
VEAKKVEAARQKQAALEAKKAEAARQKQAVEAKKVEAVRQKQAALEAEKAEAARLQQAALEAEKAEAARQEQLALEAEKAEAARRELAAFEASQTFEVSISKACMDELNATEKRLRKQEAKKAAEAKMKAALDAFHLQPILKTTALAKKQAIVGAKKAGMVVREVVAGGSQ